MLLLIRHPFTICYSISHSLFSQNHYFLNNRVKLMLYTQSYYKSTTNDQVSAEMTDSDTDISKNAENETRKAVRGMMFHHFSILKVLNQAEKLNTVLIDNTKYNNDPQYHLKHIINSNSTTFDSTHTNNTELSNVEIRLKRLKKKEFEAKKSENDLKHTD